MSVKKIDDESTFNGLISNLKTEKELEHAGSKVINNNYKSWVKKLNIDSNGELEWVTAKVQEIIYICLDTDKPSTSRIRLEALANLLLLINKNAFKSISKKLFRRSIEIQQDITEIKDNQEYTEREEASKITFNDIVTMREKYKNKKSHKDKITYLLLCLNTYMPPLRMDYIDNGKSPISFGNSNENYIEDKLNFEGIDEMTLHIEHDKVSSKVGPIDLDFHDHATKNDIMYINGTEMKKIIRESYNSYPRMYVINDSYDKNKPMTAKQYYRLMEDVFNKPVTQNSIRKAYINHWYDPELKLTMVDKKIIASYMRSSVMMAESIYRKIE